ncbi:MULTISPECIES: hypothetical protein [unclassified Streptomyces]|uniref:hypothetical protein n=1 Tax=unclassified Streptomyces TaxID=2593676 RepID=UPI0035D6BD29
MSVINALAWALDAGADRHDLAAAWAAGVCVPIPLGHRWEVVRLTSRLGYAALARTVDLGTVGPVLRTASTMTLEVVVPRGTAAAWPALPSTCATAAGTLLCPPPAATVSTPRAHGRLWVHSPAHAVAPTDPDALCEAAAATLAHMRTHEAATSEVPR